MTDIQAALGSSQIVRLNEYVSRRHEIAGTYDAAFRSMPLRTPHQIADTHSSYHLYIIRLTLDAIEHGHREVFESLRAHGIGVNLHYIPVHLQPYYRALGFSPGDFPEAEQYYREAISLPMFPTMQEQDIDTVIRAVQTCVA